jgi:hypothetical protein
MPQYRIAMAQYRKRPVIIEAVRYDGTNWEQISEWIGAKGPYDPMDPVIATLEGDMRVSAGDWVIKGVKGEFYPIKDHIFIMTYEPV